MSASTASPSPTIEAPGVFRITAIAIFLAGAVLHTTSLVLGPDRLATDYLTPPVDGAFGFLMLISAVAGWLSFRRFAGSRALRAGLLFALVLITSSVPVHLRAFVVGSTQYITMFPSWYSAVEIPMFLALAWLVTRMRWHAFP